jgi:hypothetical protein
VDEGKIPPGSVVVTEAMINPDKVSDAQGEWFELTNTWGNPINLHSWTVYDGDGPDFFTVHAPEGLLLQAEGALVFCRNKNTSLNGGVVCDYDYDDFQLANTSDEVILSLAGVEMERWEYNTQTDFPYAAGASISLDPNAIDHAKNDNPAHWCATPREDENLMESGDYGSPGAKNPPCSGPAIIHSVVPDNGIKDGGETVTLKGENFEGTTKVEVGGAPCADWSLVDQSTLICLTPAHSPGAVNIVVAKGDAEFTLTNAYTYTGDSPVALEWCDLQWPASTTATSSNDTEAIYGQVYAGDLTPTAGPPPGIRAELGWGTYESDPRSTAGWFWNSASWNTQVGDNDEFQGVLQVAEPGVYSYAYRFSDDSGVNYLYCDFDPGTGDSFSTEDLGTLVVE